MAYSYEYTKSGEPCIPMIREEVAASEMSEKTILRFYDAVRTRPVKTEPPTSVTFKVEMNSELSVEDKAILDSIIDASIGKHRVTESARTILGNLFESCADQAQQMRLLAALDKRPSFDRAIENQNFPLAYTLMAMSLADGDIIEADVTLIESIVPASKWVD